VNVFTVRVIGVPIFSSEGQRSSYGINIDVTTATKQYTITGEW